jgi:hypothetical protein
MAGNRNSVTLSYQYQGDDMVSTWVTKPEVHAEAVDALVKTSANQ